MDSIHNIDDEVDYNLFERRKVNWLMLSLKLENERRESFVDSVPDHILPITLILI